MIFLIKLAATALIIFILSLAIIALENDQRHSALALTAAAIAIVSVLTIILSLISMIWLA